MRNPAKTSARRSLTLEARRYLILEAMKDRKVMSLEDIRKFLKAKDAKLTDPTLRGDINALVSLPTVVKYGRGGLQVRTVPNFKDTYFGRNLDVKKTEKDQIARYLIEGRLEAEDERPDTSPYAEHWLIDRDCDNVVVGPGTSTLAVLRILAEYPSIETLTTNLGILDQVPDFITKPFLHLSGGWVLSGVGSLVGDNAVRNIKAFYGAKTAIIGVSGFCIGEDDEIWLYCHQEAQLPVKKALIEDRKKVIVVTCSEKLGESDSRQFFSVRKILQYADLYVFTDRINNEKVRKQLTSRLNELNELEKAKGHKARIIELPEKNHGRSVGAPNTEGENP